MQEKDNFNRIHPKRDNKLLKIMKTYILITFLCVFSAMAENLFPQSESLTLKLTDVTVKDAIRQIEQSTDYLFLIMDESEKEMTKTVSIDLEDKTIDEILTHLFKNTQLSYSIVKRQITIRKNPSVVSLAPQRTSEVEIELETERIIRGTITNVQGEAIIGANIIEKGTSNGTITDIDGNFSLSVDQNSIIVISYIGYISLEVNTAGQNRFNIVLQEDAGMLDEVVVVGYGAQIKKDITGSVAVIDMDELLKTTGSSPTQLLQGKSPGIYIGQTGSPGSPTNVRIRGFNTINSNGPLYVIDGVSTQTQDLSSINPNDIESMQVLKDASASAIYGAQAANGVIIITTKQGIRSGKTVLNYDGYYGFQRAQNNWDLMDSYELMDFLWESQLNSLRLRGDFISQPYNAQLGRGPKPIIPNYMVSGEGAEGRQDIDPDKYHMPDYIITEFGNTNWFYVINRDAPIQNHQLTLQGGGNSGQYFLGLNYFDQQGTLHHTYYKRYQARVNTTFDVTARLRFGENLQFSVVRKNGQDADTGDASMFSGVYRSSPFLPPYDIKGNFSPTNLPGVGGVDNRLALLTRRKDNFAQNSNLFGNIWGEFDILSNRELTFRSSLGVNYTTYWDYFMRKNSPETSYSEQNRLDESAEWGMRFVFTNTLSYNKLFNNRHRLNAMVGSEAINAGIGRGLFGRRYNYLFQDNVDTWTLGMGENNSLRENNSWWAGEFALFGIFARADYSYSDKYLLTTTIRRDGTSRFSKNNRYGVFPSLSAGWRLSEESFMENTKGWLDDLKLRFGYGHVGNSELPRATNFASLFTTDYRFSNYDLLGNNATSGLGYRLSTIGNPETRWESIKMINLGLDATFGGNRFYTTLEYYRKETTDMLIQASFTALAGDAAPPYVNYGSMLNYGWDYMLNYNDRAGDFRWDLSLNLSTYKNRVLKLSEESEDFALWGNAYRMDYSTNKTMAGHPIGDFYGFIIEGFYNDENDVLNSPTPYGATPDRVLSNPAEFVGKWKYADTNDDERVNVDDRVYIGSPHPDLIASFNATLYWKNFDLTMFWYSTIGNEMINSTKIFTDFPLHGGNKARRIVGTHFEIGKDNSNAKLPILDERDSWSPQVPSTYFVEDASFLKLKNLVLGYTLPRNILKSINVSNLRVYLQAENLLTFTKYLGLDPELTNRDTSDTGAGTDLTRGIDAGGWPTTSRFLVGLNFTF